MQERELIAGFSELKDLLIDAYKIDRDRVTVRLHFSQAHDEILMHDFDDQSKVVWLVLDIENNLYSSTLSGYALKLVQTAVQSRDPVEFLKLGFRLYGFCLPHLL